MRIVLFIYLFLLNALTGFSQKSGQECRELLIRAHEEAGKIGIPPSGKIYHLAYTVKTVYREPYKNRNQTVDVNVYTGNGQYHVLTDEVRVYQDKDVAIFEVPSRKFISIIDAVDPAAQERVKDLRPYDKFLEISTVKSCRAVEGGGDYDTELVMELNDSGRKKYRISQVKYLINSPENRVVSVTLDYEEGYTLERVEYIFQKLDADHKGYLMSEPVLSRYMKEGAILEKYKSYTITDKRTK